MRPKFLFACSGACTILWVAVVSSAFAADEPGSADHPLVGRYEGSTIVFNKPSDFDETALLQAPHDHTPLLERYAVGDRSGAEWVKPEGRVIKIRYEVSAGRSSLEVFRNYGTAVETGEDKERITAFVLVIGAKALEIDKIAFRDAGQMAQTTAEDQKVNLYGITFDDDKDVLRPESKPTLDEIAKLLNEQPELRLEVVGHVDDQGSADYNMDLSHRRAARVVAALTDMHGIAGGRLTSSGADTPAPMASNATRERQAKNRRVELVAK